MTVLIKTALYRRETGNSVSCLLLGRDTAAM